MIKMKSISKRALALALAILTMLSCGIISAVAANVELAPTGFSFAGGYIYFDNTKTGWTDSYISLVIGKDSWSTVYQMTKVGNTNLYRRSLPTSGWGDATYLAFMGTSTSWGEGNWGYSNISSNATHYTAKYTTSYDFKANQYALATPSSSSNGTAFSINYKGTAASSLNVTARANVYSATATGTTYSSNALAGKVTVSGYYMSSYSATSSRSAVSSSDSTAYASTTLAITSKATFTAEAKDGYTFEGWYSSSSSTSALSTSTTYTTTLGTSNHTVYAKFKEEATAPSAPSSVKIEVLNAYAGTGTQADPYIVLPDTTINTKITCVASDAANTTGFLYNVNYTAGWATGAAGETEFLYDGLAKLANGATGEYTPYAWAYNGSADNKSAMTTGTKIYIKAAYANVTATFKDWDGTVLDTVEVEYGGTPAYTEANPTRTGYRFAGWTPEIGPITNSITYTATYTPNEQTVTITSANGTVTVSPKNNNGKVNYDDTITVQVTPATGYRIKSVTINNGAESITNTKASQTVKVQGNVVINVEYTVIVYHTIAISQTGGTGTVTTTAGTVNNNQINIEEGTEVTVTVKAPANCYISKINDVENTNQGKTEESFTFASLDKDETIKVEYTAKSTFNITVTNMNEAGGTYTIDKTSGLYDDQFTISATANTGYVFAGFTVNGSEKDTNPLTMAITGNMEISVNWKEQGWEGIIYVEDQAGWGNVNAWVWNYVNNDNYNGGTWPGDAMTEVGTSATGKKIYAIRVGAEAEQVANSEVRMILTNNSSSTQRIDYITLKPDVNYYVITGDATYTQSFKDLGVTLPVKIYLDYGANKHYQVSGAATNITIGHTTLNTEEEGVLELSERKRCGQHDNNYYDTGYMSAKVSEGVPVTIQCTIQSDATEYMVDGFVIDGKEYITANYMGNNLYTATYSFTKDGTVVVPIYSYTDAYLQAEGLTEITLYAQKPDDFEGDWGDYMAAYVWYDMPGDKTTTDYIFGAWPGQIMIPVAGTDNYWYTTVTSKSANDYPASGITFSNYGGWESTTGVLYPVTNTTNIQVFDYYEFITLANQEVDNITYVLKNGEGDNGGGSGVTITDSYFTNYVNISNETIDIYGDEIADDAAIGLYVIRNAPVSSTVSPLSGNYYVQCSLYQANGTYIGQCFSYELLDIDALATKLSNSYLAGLKGKRVRVDYETMIHSQNVDTNSAMRYDGQWYNAVVDVELSVNVAETFDNGATYTVTNNSPANVAIYGSAFVGGGEVSVVERGDTVALAATPAAGYKFVGWYASNGTRISTSTTTSIDAVIDATYTAVFQALGEGEFVVTHEIYHGGGSSAYIPEAHGGRADLYVGIVNDTTGETFAFTKTGMGSVTAREGDELIITIGTDPLGVDRFFSWYIDAVDKYGLTTYEEVGVDNYDGSGEYGNLYDNGVDTVEGSSQLVRFQFKYTVKPDIFNIALYSDVLPTSANAKLVYKYENRYGEVKSVTVPYVLTDEEIDGCEGNGGKPMTPTQKTIYDNAPFVEDFYKDSTWKITDALYNELLYELWATQPDTVYTVTINAGGTVSYKSGTFNTEVEVNARDNNPTLSNSGFWYIDANRSYAYEEAYDSVLSYGVYYGLRITDDMMIGYQTVDQLQFDVLLGAPEYGREQNTDSSGGNATDFIYIDYLESFLVPYFNGNTTEDGKKINGVYYNDELIPTSNTSVTLETLEKLDYEFDYGMIFEQINPSLVNTEWGKNPASESVLSQVAAGATGFVGDGNTNSKYYTLTSAVDNFYLTNKNRLLFTIKMDNTSANQNKYYNVYGYLAVTDSTGKTSYYFSNQQTLNILDIGNNKGNEQAPDASN